MLSKSEYQEEENLNTKSIMKKDMKKILGKVKNVHDWLRNLNTQYLDSLEKKTKSKKEYKKHN